MRPEMRFRGTIEVERIRSALVVAKDAVVNTPGGPVVRRRRFTGLQTIPVTLGRSTAELVEILPTERPSMIGCFAWLRPRACG